MASKKEELMGLFSTVTGKKLEDFKEKPKDLAEILNKEPEAEDCLQGSSQGN
jgi:ABC-type Fe3+-hydroxamate transport system substrate-binding protein